MGYDLEHFVGEVEKNVLCAICAKVLQEPFKCSQCKSLACSGCWQDASSQQENDDEKPASKTFCPSCKAKGVETTGSEDPSVGNLVDKIGTLTVHCPHRGAGCETTLPLATVREHVVSQCQHTQLMCPHGGCTQGLTRSQYEEHVTTGCEFRLVACAACGAQLAQRDLCTHQQQSSCFHQLQRRRLVQAQKEVARGLRDHRMAIQRARHSTEQDERRVMREHFQNQQRQIRRSYSAPAVRLSLDNGILGPLGSFRIGSAVPHFSRNMQSVTATPLSPRGTGRPVEKAAFTRPGSCRRCSIRFLPSKGVASGVCTSHRGGLSGTTCTNCPRWRTLDTFKTGLQTV